MSSGRRNWEHVILFYAFSDSVRRIIFITNAIEALHSKLRRAVRTKGHFPRVTRPQPNCFTWSSRGTLPTNGAPTREWFEANNQLAVIFLDRFPTT